MKDKRLLGFILLMVLGAYAIQTLYVLSINPQGELIDTVYADVGNQPISTDTDSLRSSLFSTGSAIWQIISFNVWAGMENPEVIPSTIRYLVQLLIAVPINLLGLICIIELVLQFIPFVGD